MKKAGLREVPHPEVGIEQIRAVAVADKNIRAVIVSQVETVKEQETLILNVFQVSGKNKRDISILFRVFCQKEDYITLEVDNGKWRTGALLHLICRDSGWCEYWWNYTQLTFRADEDADLVEKTFRSWSNCDEKFDGRAAVCLLDRYQNHIKHMRLMKKHKKETDVIDAEMEKFGELPDDYQQFVEEKVFSEDNYIFYDTKRARAFCTSCKHTFVLKDKKLRHETIGIMNTRDEVRHNHSVCCPYCNKFLHAKSEGMSRQSLVSVQWSVLVQSHGEEVLTRYFCHIKDFRTNFRKPKISTSEDYRTVHTAEKVQDYMWAHYKATKDMRWCYYRDRGSSWYPPAETVAPRSAMLYNTDLPEVIKGTCMKYSVPDIFIENVANDPRHFNSPWLIDNYFNSYRKYPFIEQLLKVGFYKMVQQFLEDHRWNNTDLNAGCSSILGTLGINKNQYNMLRKVGNPSLKDLEILRYKPDLKWDEFSDLRWVQDDGYTDMYKKFIDFMQYTTLYKLRKYMTEQKIKHFQDYFDYGGWLEKMGYDMRNEFNLFPRDFKKAHDEMSKQYMKFKDKQAREDAKRFNKLLQKLKKETTDVEAMNLNIAGLFIRLPNKLEELKVEGEVLHHCVGTYTEKVRKGETMIFFVRKIEEPDKPFYTLEWKGRVVQCRGSHNCDMIPEVKAFVEIFQSKMVEYEKLPKKQRKAG